MRGRENRRAAAGPSGALLPGQTNLDFLDGSFTFNERSRLAGLVAVGVSTLLLLTSAGVGVVSDLDGARAADRLATANETASRLSVELGQLSNTGGVGERDLTARRTLIAGQLADAEASQLDVLRITNDLAAAVAGNGRIVLVEVTRDETGAQTLNANVALTGFESLTDLSDGLTEHLWYLEAPEVNWTSGGEAALVVVSIKAKVGAGVADGRAAELRERFGLTDTDTPPPAAPPAPAGDADSSSGTSTAPELGAVLGGEGEG